MVTHNEPFFGGHFPGYPLLPAVLLLEMMAQACAALARLDRPGLEGSRPQIGRFAAVDKARFRHEVRPGYILSIEARLERRVGRLATYAASAQLRTQIVADALLTLATPSQKRGA
jgi:3-hydroxyacyl-[acyl-carrier-protein] dehydratase